MCLGVPGRVAEIYEENGLRMAKVDFGGVVQRVCLAHTPEAEVGKFVVVHVGFSLSVIDAEEADQVFSFLERLGELEGIQSPDIQGRGETA